MMLADRSDEHQELFKEGEEAEFFSSGEELKDKTAFYLKREDLRSRIALAGYRRCFESGYNYRKVMELRINQIKAITGIKQ